MADPQDYAPKQPQFATIRPGEKHLHSFILHPIHQVRSGGLIFKITVWEPDGTRHLLHLTDQRMVFEPIQIPDWEILVSKLMHSAADIFMGDSAAGALNQAERGIDQLQAAQATMQRVGGHWLEIAYSDVHSVSTFRQGLGTYIRLQFRGADAPFNTSVSGAHQRSMSLGCATECVDVIESLRKRAKI